MKIHEGRGTSRWCGPMAVSIVTGRQSHEVSALIRILTGRRMVTGTHHHELRQVFEQWGYRMRLVSEWPSMKNRPTIAKWLKLSKAERTAGRVYLLSAGHHWQIVSGRKFACSMTRGKIVSVRDDLVGRRRRVKTVYEITKD